MCLIDDKLAVVPPPPDDPPPEVEPLPLDDPQPQTASVQRANVKDATQEGRERNFKGRGNIARVATPAIGSGFLGSYFAGLDARSPLPGIPDAALASKAALTLHPRNPEKLSSFCAKDQSNDP